MWNISKVSYYADWVLIPILGLLAILSDVLSHGAPSFGALIAFALGALLWSFAEYATHRWLFHRVYRVAHWQHHTRPAAYIGVPAWQAAVVHVVAFVATLGVLGFDIGTGAFLGLEAGYFLYIWAHDRFHHHPRRFRQGSYWDRRERAHAVHHKRGIEANFGVATPLWDVLFGTYRAPYVV